MKSSCSCIKKQLILPDIAQRERKTRVDASPVHCLQILNVTNRDTVAKIEMPLRV